MERSLTAIFDNRRSLDAAIAELHGSAVAVAIHVAVGDPTGADSPITGNGGALAPPHAGPVGNFLRTVFGTDNSAPVQTIDGAVTHSHLALTVTASQADPGDVAALANAAAIIARHAPVRMDRLDDDGSAAPPRLDDAYAPAYLYGVDLATHEQHGGGSWHEAEAGADLRGARPDPRRKHARRHPHSAWARLAGALRRSWERLRK